MLYEKAGNNSREIFRLLKIHEMTGIGDYDPTGVWNAGFNRARVRMHIRNVGIADQDQRRHVDLMEARQ